MSKALEDMGYGELLATSKRLKAQNSELISRKSDLEARIDHMQFQID